MDFIFLFITWIACAWIGHYVGKSQSVGDNSGYNLGYDRGYHQCAIDYNIKEVGVLDYFQDRDFEIKTGIHQSREFEKEIKGKKRNEGEN